MYTLLIPAVIFTNMNPNQTVILDIFGTLATIERPHRSFSILRETLNVSKGKFGRAAMTDPHTLTSLSQIFGRVDPQVLTGIERLLWDEVASIRFFPESLSVLRELLAQGSQVILASNLALPFGCAIELLLDNVGPWQALNATNGKESALLAYSYNLGSVKPEDGFYKTINDYAQPYQTNTWMIGDRYEEDCLGAIKAGWNGYHLRRDEGENLMDAMLKLGILK